VNCPLCIDEVLDVAYHGGIEVDICPRCRGVWLDRGELEKLAGSKGGGKTEQPNALGRQAVGHAAPPQKADKANEPKKKKKKKKKSLGSRLGDVLEEVLDL
jgi:Zn-finger nucleic acid-binding protein